MNSVTLIGRLTKDIELKYLPNQTAVAKFTLAINRGKDKEADFVPVTVFGKQAENCERFLKKGKQVAIQGRIQTGSYEKDGRTIYTTDVIADRVEFLEWEKKEDGVQKYVEEATPMFSAIEEDIPFN